MRKMIYSLSFLALILMGVAIVLWLFPSLGMPKNSSDREVRYGIYEGLELVSRFDKWGRESIEVEDAHGERLFSIPLHNCMIDTRYRNGRLQFCENGTNRTGYVDRNGQITFTTEADAQAIEDKEEPKEIASARPSTPAEKSKQQDPLLQMARSNPFYSEASKVIEGKLPVDDANNRRQILGYCEQLRTAYSSKDIAFIRQVYSEQALIIVGNVVRTRSSESGQLLDEERVEYNIHAKKDYIERLEKVFKANKKIDCTFSDFHIYRHPTMEGIYGVTLRQRYKSDRYSDDGYLFLLWDFRNLAMPQIHVRTWQPTNALKSPDDVMSITDFNLK